MRLIDEKGRLFGKINIVDLSIILVLLIAIPLLFYSYKVLGKRPTPVSSRWIKVEVVTFTIEEIAALFEPGDTSYDEFGNPDGRVLDVLRKDRNYTLRFRKTKYDTHEQRKIPMFLELELLCTKTMENEPWYYKRVHLRHSLDVGFRFDTTKYTINCYILKIKE